MESNVIAKVSTKSGFPKAKNFNSNRRRNRGYTTFVINVTTHTLKVKSTIEMISLVPAPVQVDQSWQGLDSTASIPRNRDVFEGGTNEQTNRLSETD